MGILEQKFLDLLDAIGVVAVKLIDFVVAALETIKNIFI